MNTQTIERFLSKDFSKGTEAFREDLLQRCLSEIDEDSRDCVSLSDDELDMLAAAGTPYEDRRSAQERFEGFLSS